MLVSYLFPVLSALLLAFVCQSVGWPLVPQRFPAPERLLAAFGVGLWIVSIAVLLWGLTVGLTFERIIILWIALVLGCCRHFRSLIAEYGRVFGGKFSRGRTSALILVALLALWGLAFALVPPLFSDTLRYHLGVPHRWLMDEKIAELPRFCEQHLVMMWQHAAILLLGIGQPIGAKVFMFLGFPLCLLALAAAVRSCTGNVAASIFAVLILGSTPTFFGNSVLGGVDSGLALFAAMALIFLFSNDSRKWIWVGWMGGLALCTKWQGAAVIVGAAVCAFRQSGVRALLIVLVASAGAYFPWAVRNIAWSADPFYPFLAQAWDPEAASISERFGRLIDGYALSGEHWWQYLLYPFHLASGSGLESSIGWIYLLILPLALLGAVRDERIRPVLMFSVAALITGFGMGQLPRFWMPVWVALAMAGGLIWMHARLFGRMSLFAMVTLAAFWQLFGISSALNQKGFAALSYHGSGAPGDFYAKLSPEWRAAEWVRGRRSQERSLLVGLDGNLFWTTPIVVDGPYDNKSIVAVARESKSSGEMADRLKKIGIQLLVIDSARAELLDRQFGYMGWDAPTRARVREFFATQVVRRYQDGTIQIGELK